METNHNGFDYAFNCLEFFLFEEIHKKKNANPLFEVSANKLPV